MTSLAGRSFVLINDSSGQQFIVQVDKKTGKIVQITSPASFRVGIDDCDAALTVTGPVFSLCENATSIFQGDMIVCGSVNAGLGFSGSLTRLADGSPYLIAGSNITIVSASNGSITLSSTAGGGGGGPCTDLWTDETTAGVSQTGSVTVGNGAGISGIASASLGFSGSLQRLRTDTVESYIVQGPNISVVTESNGSITISAPASGSSYFFNTLHFADYTATTERFFSFETAGTTATKPTLTANTLFSWTAPWDGELLQAAIHTESSVSSATLRLYKSPFPMSLLEGVNEAITTGGASTGFKNTFEFTNATFLKNERLAMSIHPNAFPNTLALTLSWKFNTLS